MFSTSSSTNVFYNQEKVDVSSLFTNFYVMFYVLISCPTGREVRALASYQYHPCSHVGVT